MLHDPTRRPHGMHQRPRRVPVVVAVRDFVRDCLEDIPLLTRIASHVGLVVLMVITVAVSNLRFSGAERTEVALASGNEDESPFQATDVGSDDVDFSIPLVSPLTSIPKRTRRDVAKYTVQAGDTISDIAAEFDVSADSVLWANPKLEDNPDMLSIGQVLNIPPTTGVLYTVQTGDTVQKIAAKFKTAKTSADKLVDNTINFEFNQELHDLKGPDYKLVAGQFLMVPSGVKPYIPKVLYTPSGPVPGSAARGTGRFGWPVSGRITQKFWTRHPGIDVAAPSGTPVYAADAGYVSVAGWDQERVSYGYMILINHGNGYVTRYGHLSKFNVEVGDSVKKGQIIGRVGSTGNSTGPHLHFEIYKNGARYDPFSFLR